MGFVYLIYNGNGQAKVGHTNFLDRRLKQLQTGSPHKLEFLRFFECSQAEEVESKIHDECSSLRISGEWFRLSALLLDSFIRHERAQLDSVVLSIKPGDEGQTWRTSRLERALYKFQAMTDSVALARLHDHEGCLTATWRRQPSEDEMESIRLAWEEENEHLVEHEVES